MKQILCCLDQHGLDAQALHDPATYIERERPCLTRLQILRSKQSATPLYHAGTGRISAWIFGRLPRHAEARHRPTDRLRDAAVPVRRCPAATARLPDDRQPISRAYLGGFELGGMFGRALRLTDNTWTAPLVKLTVSGWQGCSWSRKTAAALASTLGKIAPPARSGVPRRARRSGASDAEADAYAARPPEAGRLDRDGDDAAGRPFGEAFRTHAALDPRSTWRAR